MQVPRIRVALSFWLAAALTVTPAAVAVAETPSGRGTDQTFAAVLDPSVSKADVDRALVIGERFDPAVFEALADDSGDASSKPMASPAASQKSEEPLGSAAPAQVGTDATTTKLSFKDCIGSGEATLPRGQYSGRWSWCQSRTMPVVHVIDGVIVGNGSFQSTLVGEGIKGKRNVKVFQYITEVDLYGAWDDKSASVRFTLPCGGWPTAANCQSSGGMTWRLITGRGVTISYLFTSSTSGAVRTEKVGIGVFKATFTMLTGAAVYGPEQGFRCDSATYLGKNGACVFDRFTATFTMSRSDSAVNEAAKHIYDALRGASNIYPGKGKAIPSSLTRMTSKKGMDANTRKAVAACKKRWPTRPKGKDCDEYPFKSTNQGAAKANGKFSVRYITSADNQRAGSKLGAWYKSQRILDGERFNVGTKA